MVGKTVFHSGRIIKLLHTLCSISDTNQPAPAQHAAPQAAANAAPHAANAAPHAANAAPHAANAAPHAANVAPSVPAHATLQLPVHTMKAFEKLEEKVSACPIYHNGLVRPFHIGQ